MFAGQRTDRDSMIPRVVGGLDGQDHIVVVEAAGRGGPFMPLAPVGAEVLLDVLQDRDPLFVDLAAAIAPRGPQAVEKRSQLLTAGQHREGQSVVRPAWSLHGGGDVVELLQEVIPS